MFAAYQERLEKKVKIECDASGNERIPPESLSLYSSSSSSSYSSCSHHSNKNNKYANKPLVKLDVKFDLPVFNGEFHGENLDN